MKKKLSLICSVLALSIALSAFTGCKPDNGKNSTSEEKVETVDFVLYGIGFSDFYMQNSGVEDIKIEDTNKINILILPFYLFFDNKKK